MNSYQLSLIALNLESNYVECIDRNDAMNGLPSLKTPFTSPQPNSPYSILGLQIPQTILFFYGVTLVRSAAKTNVHRSFCQRQVQHTEVPSNRPDKEVSL